jgi:hypothetical protein
MTYNLNPYYINLFLIILIVILIIIAYNSRCNYNDLITKMNQLSLTEIGE